MKSVRQTYEQRAEQFAKVCDIGIKILAEANIPIKEKTRMLRIGESDKELALHPLPMYKRIASLKCIEAEHFWYWNESNGSHIDKFWEELRNCGFDYQRKDLFRKIFKGGKISNQIEYDYVIDEMLVAKESGRIKSEEFAKLNTYLLSYENRRGRKDGV